MKLVGQVASIRSKYGLQSFDGKPIAMDVPVDVVIRGVGFTFEVDWTDPAVPVVGSLVAITVEPA